MSTLNGNQEEVIFTEDFDVDAKDFCNPGFQVDYDEVIQNTLPGIFPINYNLRRE